MDMKLEVVVIPVTDVARAKVFYSQLGWRLDADIARGGAIRVVQFTPPGSSCSIHFGKGLTTAPPGSAQNLYLVVSNVDDARAQLISRGVEVSETYHRTAEGIAGGRDPAKQSYASFATFRDPDGNGWLLQEITTRMPGRVEGLSVFESVPEVAAALRRAAKAHGEHERLIGQQDENWPDWYAQYLVNERAVGVATA